MITKPYIIAEIASAHGGNYELAIDIAKQAVKTGADAVKFQIFNKDHLLITNNPYYNEFAEIELTPQEWKVVLDEISIDGIDIIIEPYDINSFDLSEETGQVRAYKIPTASIGDIDLINKIKNTGKTVYIGVGGAEWQEIEQVVSILSKSKVVLLCGFQNFPTKLEDSKLIEIHKLKKAFDCKVGYADHVDAEDIEMSRLVPVLAIGMGASVIEKHITNNRSIKGKDYYSALNPAEFKSFVKLMHSIPKIIGLDNKWTLSEAEKKYRIFTKKHAVAADNIDSGKKLSMESVVFKRTNHDGMSRQDILNFIGKRLLCSKLIDEPFTLGDFIE